MDFMFWNKNLLLLNSFKYLLVYFANPSFNNMLILHV